MSSEGAQPGAEVGAPDAARFAGGSVPQPAAAPARADPATPGWTWYYLSGGKSVGPLGDAEFRELVVRGRVRPETAVWSAALGSWRRARAVYELVETLHAGGEARAKAPPTNRGQVIVRTLGVAMVGRNVDPKLQLLIPTGLSSNAVTAGYLGLFSFMIVTAPVAILCGILGLREIRTHRELRGRGRAWFGIVMGSAALVVFVLMLAGVIPSPF